MKTNCFILAAQKMQCKMNPAVSVIYVNYNTSALLLQSISSLIVQCREIPLEIIIIDNASRPEEKLKIEKGLEEIMHENTKLILSDTNDGFSKANNLGTKNASGKYLFFLNPDTFIINDVIRIFYDFMESSGKETAACGGNLLRADHTPNYSYGNFPGLLYEVCSIGFGLRYLFNDYYKRRVFIGRTVEGNDLIEAPYITGADIFIRSDYFNKLKGFDENFFMYYEETDLFMRLQQKGYKSYILPEARIIHFEGGAVAQTSSDDFNYRKFEMTLRSKLYYFCKWFPPYNLTILKTVILLQILVQYLKGNKGSSFTRLISIYRQNIRISRLKQA